MNFDAQQSTSSHHQSEQPAAILMLEDGRIFSGVSYGARGTKVAPITISIGMTGYQEVLSNPANADGFIALTFPHIGNTGVNAEDGSRTKSCAAGVIVREGSRLASSWRASGELEEYLIEHNIIGISEIDTRALTRHLRQHRQTSAVISTEIFDPTVLAEHLQHYSHNILKNSPITGLSSDRNDRVDLTRTNNAQIGRMAVIDLGLDDPTAAVLADQGLGVQFFDQTVTATQIRQINPSAVVLSQGPGDPANFPHLEQEIACILDDKIPIFATGLGYQVLARCLGFSTYELSHGHHSANHPVHEVSSGRVLITGHNHRYAVRADQARQFNTRWGRGRISYVSLNDGVVEGVSLSAQIAVGVQFDLGAGPGPHDGLAVLNQFMESMTSATN